MPHMGVLVAVGSLSVAVMLIGLLAMCRVLAWERGGESGADTELLAGLPFSEWKAATASLHNVDVIGALALRLTHRTGKVLKIVLVLVAVGAVAVGI